MPRAELGEYKECTWFAVPQMGVAVVAILDPPSGVQGVRRWEWLSWEVSASRR